MAKQRAARPIVWLRRFLLLGLVLLLGLLGLYLFGRSGRQPPPPGPPDAEESAVAAGEGVTSVGEGFEYTHYKEGRPSFTLSADKTLEDREETVYLQDVALTLYEEDGSAYEMQAERATYHRERQEALLEGDVRLHDQRGFRMTGEALELVQEGRLLNSLGPVTLYYQDRYQATGDRLRVHLPEDFFLLAGHVALDSLPGADIPVSLRAEQVRLERSRQLLRAEGGVELRHGSDLLRARSLNIFLEEDLSTVRFLRARWEVLARQIVPGTADAAAAGPPAPTVLQVAGRSLSVLMLPGGEGADNAQVEGSPAEPAVLRTDLPDGTSRVLTAGYLSGRFTGGELEEVEAFGNPVLVELTAAGAQLPGAPERRLEGGRALVRAAGAGRLSSVRFFDGVSYRDPEVEVHAEWAEFDAAEGKGEFYGSDAPMPKSEDATPPPPPADDRAGVERVRVTSSQGELEAPRIDYDRGSGVVHAYGGRVLAFMPGDVGGLPAPDLAGDEGGTRVEANQAWWRRSPQSVLFRGEVRAWRGENVLLAGWLRGDEEGGKLTAGDGVRTVAVPEPRAGQPAAPPLTVRAQDLLYRRDAGEVVYEGEVRAEQEGKKLSCERMETMLEDDQQAERLTCTGAVHFEDPAAGNQVEAERAVYRTQAREAEFFGAPAVVRDAQGRVVEAPHLTYDVEAGRVRAEAGVPAAAEASPSAGEGS